jgi:hypothetical protein
VVGVAASPGASMYKERRDSVRVAQNLHIDEVAIPNLEKARLQLPWCWVEVSQASRGRGGAARPLARPLLAAQPGLYPTAVCAQQACALQSTTLGGRPRVGQPRTTALRHQCHHIATER